MNQDQDFSSLRNLLALKRLDMPQDTQVNEFLFEFHRRQRAQLLVRESLFTRATAWVKEKASSLALVPSLSYGTALAAIAITAMVGLSQQVQVTGAPGQPYKLSFRLAPHDSAFAMIPSSFTPAANTTPVVAENLNFTPSRSESTPTRFVLANNTSHGAYDATVAF